jgi:hypothetical protein
MITSLVAADWDRWKALPISRQKKDALFELACRIALISERARDADCAGIAAAAKTEKRKTLIFGLEILAEGGDAEALDQAYELDPVFRDLDPGTRLELAMVRKGLISVAAREHPFVAMRRMAAFLGPEYFDKASDWMAAGIKRKKRRSQSLLVPGELPDVIRHLAAEGTALERALRASGRSLAAAALAGCPQESVDLASPCFGTIGGASLAEDSVYLRGKLSSEEISQLQSAFLDVVHGLEEGGEVELSEAEELYGDPDFVAELSKAILDVDERALKASLKGVEARLLAMAMQGMEPAAHERILSLLTKKEERRVLDAIDAMILLPRREIEESGSALARSLLISLSKLPTAVAGPKESASETAKLIARIRDWPTVEGKRQDKGSAAIKP